MQSIKFGHTFAAEKSIIDEKSIMKKLFTAIIFCTTLSSTISAAEVDTLGYNRFRFGGYGEMVANFKDYGLNRFNGSPLGNTKDNRNTISIPRFVLALDYKFNSKWILGAEIEFEAGGTGSAVELEKNENQQYETEVEKGGEVALEQLHITRLIVPEFNVRAGHLIVPVGLTNAHHEPINFFGTSRPEGESTILPCTWHQTGLSFFGEFGKGLLSFDYEAMIVAGLNPDGFNRDNWIQGGRQGLFEEDNFTSPGYVARLNWTGVKGLRLGVSGYFCNNVLSNADKPWKYADVPSSSLSILSADGQFVNQYVTMRANVLWGNLDNANKINGYRPPESSPYTEGQARNVAKTAMTWGAELGCNLKTIIGCEKFPVVYPFVRYEYYNSQQSGVGTQTIDSRCQVSMWQGGLNWKPLPNLVVKANYTTRQIGTNKIFGTSNFNSENEFSIGIAYIGWFVKK